MKMIEIEGPGRDYDVIGCCLEHHVEADEFAREWISELLDDLDSGESATLTVRIVDGSEFPCVICGDEP